MSTKFSDKSNEQDSSERKREEEMEALEKFISAMLMYERESRKWVDKLKINWDLIQKAPETKEIITRSGLSFRLEDYHKTITDNQKFLKQFLPNIPETENKDAKVSQQDYDKVIAVLNYFVKDWSEEGKEERRRCYQPILDELDSIFQKEGRREKCVLCPGCGLGRLPYEITKLGFNCQANEFAFSMLVPLNFILNRVSQTNQFEIFPYVHQVSNQLSRTDQFRSCKIPDVNPRDLPPEVKLSVTAGDWLEVYANDKESWDCIVTCFVLDTARNVVEYMTAIYRLLKPGGKWINFGPLLYHYEMQYQNSVAFTLEEVMTLAKTIGFKIEKEQLLPSNYTSNSLSMLKNQYNCAFFVATK